MNPAARKNPAGRKVMLALLVLALAAPALAQTPRPQQRPAPAVAPPAAPEPPPEPPPAPYEPDLLRLAEIMGSLAYLRGLCGGPEAAGWRDKMLALVESEGRSPARKERLAGAYNRGFRAYALTHRACSPTAEEATARLGIDGERLSRALAGRFGG
jgi:uncharacterized protein (TIGR02301 family)